MLLAITVLGLLLLVGLAVVIGLAERPGGIPSGTGPSDWRDRPR